MPTPPPPEHSRWQPGQSGNPGGYSSRRRVTDALVKMIGDKNADNALAMTWLAMALGDTAALKGRKPDFRFFKELLDRIDGKPEEAKPEAAAQIALTIVRPNDTDRKPKPGEPAG